MLFGDGRQTRDFTFVADVVAAMRAAGVGAGRRRARVTTSAAASRGQPQRARSSCSPRSPGARSTSAARERESGDVLHTGADIDRARERARLRAGDEPRPTGLRAEFEWVRARAGSASARLLAARGAVPSLSGA